MAAETVSRFDFIVGLHDLSEAPDARGDELDSWLPFSEARPLLDRIRTTCQRTGVPLQVTSDDAFRSDYEILMPWLLESQVPGTFFIPTRFIGLPGRLTELRMREMAGLGMRFGVHGAQHINWLAAGMPAFRADVREGKERLEQALGTAVDVVAVPFGGFNGPIVAELRTLGFRAVHTSRSGLALRDVAIKPRNMLKRSQLEQVVSASGRRGNLRDGLHCRLRQLRASVEAMVMRA